MQPDDSYYLKALDNYPYNLEDAVEALQYGLSANPEHAGLLTLQGRIYANELQSQERAIEAFSAAIAYEPGYWQAYYELGMLLIGERHMERAAKLAQLATDRFGGHHPKFIYLRACIAEIDKRYTDALALLEEAKLNSYNAQSYDFYQEEITRINKKCLQPLTISGCKVYYSIK